MNIQISKPNCRSKEAADRNSPFPVCFSITEGIVSVYVFLMLTVFPLFATDMYYNILVDKYYFFWMTTAAAAGLCAVVWLIGAFIDKREFRGKQSDGSSGARLSAGTLWKRIRGAAMPCDWFLLAFLAVALLSSALSEWQYEAFWGNMGRYQGSFFWIWCAVSYFMVTRFFRVKRWYLDAFLLVGIYIAIWGLQDFMGLDPHGWLSDIDASQINMFTSSIGNINTYTAVIILYLSAACVLFVSAETGKITQRKTGRLENRKKAEMLLLWIRFLFYAVCVFLFFMAMIAGQSDNAVLGIAVILCFLPFYAWRSRKGFVRYWFVAAAFFGAMAAVRQLAQVSPNPYIGFWSGILLGLCGKEWIGTLALAALGTALVIWALCAAIGAKAKKEAAEKKCMKAFRLIWLALGIIALFILIWLFWDANHGGHPDWYAPYAQVFYFNGDWGTHRGYNWSILIRHFSEFPLWKKLIGSGPETYGIVTRIYDYTAMVAAYGEIYDSPHNEFLQYLFTTGILGFVAYYGFVITGSLKALGLSFRKKDKVERRSSAKNPIGAAAVFAAAGYTAMSFINISVPIVVPLMLLCLFIGIASEKQRK